MAAAFKARPPPTFSPSTNDYNAFNEWRREFDTYVLVTTFFEDTVDLPVQQARLFNLAGPDFAKYVRQNVTVTATTTLATILDGVGNTLKPTRFDLQNRAKLFTHKQSQISAAKFLEERYANYTISQTMETKSPRIKSFVTSLFLVLHLVKPNVYYISRTVTI